MPQTKYKMPPDLKMRCISLVRGYDRLVRLYHERRENALLASHPPPDGMPKGTTTGDVTESKVERLEKIETMYDTQAMRAIEQAKLQIGLDIVCDAERQKLTSAIIDSCVLGRNFIFEYQNLCVGKTNFYERRKKFLYTIAQYMGFL